ncbi:hypothetical protein M408DRAFT_328454, partial [Serendipita vermifera MAFF 305830]
MESPKSPRQQTEFAVGYESRHDIELQSPIRGSSYMADEKAFPSPPPSSSDNAQQQQKLAHRVSYVGLGRPAPPTRKYSRDWWKVTWDGAIAHKTWPRVLYVGFGIIILSIWIGTTFYFATEGARWDRGLDQPFEQRRRNAASTGSNTQEGGSSPLISLSGSLKSFDPVARSLHIEWSGLYQDTPAAEPVELANGTYPNTMLPLEIYRDVSTVLFDTRTNDTETPDAEYWFRIDNSSVTPIGAIGMRPWDSFDTDISFSQYADEANAVNQPQFSYPFDEWKGGLIFVANAQSPPPFPKNILPTRQGNYSLATVFPLAGARLEDNSLNWRFRLSFENPCFSDSDNITEIIQKAYAPGTNIDPILADDLQLATINIACHLDITIVATRPPLVQFAAVMAVIVNWTSTLFIFILTCEVIIMRRGFMLSGTDLFGITFTALFALPSVRMLLPGAPEFGILLDLVGIVPNVIIVSICTSAIAVTKLNRRQHAEDKED